MNRAEIKEKARKMIKGRLWEVWKPMLIVMVIGSLIGAVTAGIDPKGTNTALSAVTIVLEFLLYPLSVGLYAYFLNFIRGKKLDVNKIWDYYKNTWPIILVCFFLMLFVGLWTLLFVIPGIIAALSYSMVMYLMADGDIDSTNTLKRSKEMMDGYKWDYFVFGLSFILWILLVMITFGIAIIYVAPYMSIANALYYEELKKKKKIKA